MYLKKLSRLLLSLLPILLLWQGLSPGVWADEPHPSRLADDAGLLSPSAADALEKRLDEISTELGFDVVIHTTPYHSGSIVDYADDYFDYGGYGMGDSYDGVLLVISMEFREWYISTCGQGIHYLRDDALLYLEEEILPPLSDDDYEEAFHIFALRCEDIVSDAKAGRAFRKPFPLASTLFISLFLGGIVASLVTASMKRKLKSVAPKAGAADYVKEGSLHLSVSRDLFLYRTVRHRVRSQSSGSRGGRTHRSSSGRSHGGRGGRF